MARVKRVSEVIREATSDDASAIRGVLARNAGSIDSEQLLRSLVEVWGGPHRLALDIHAEFAKAPPGGVTRQRILEMIQRLILTNTVQDIGRPKPASELSDEELAEVARMYLSRMKPDAQATA